MAVWDMAELPERDQFAYWHEVICKAFVPLTPVRTDGDLAFSGRVETRPLAGLTRARLSSGPQHTRHGPSEVAATEAGWYFVNLQLAGRCHVRQGSETLVEPGQFVIEGSNIGVRRRQLHELFRDPMYDPLMASGMS